MTREHYRCREITGGTIEERTRTALALDYVMVAEGFARCFSEVDEDGTLVLYRRTGVVVRPLEIDCQGLGVVAGRAERPELAVEELRDVTLEHRLQNL